MLSFDVEYGAGDARRVHWDQAMREVYGPRWQLTPARPAEFQMSMRAVQIGNVTLSRASLSQAEVSTRPYHSRNTAQHCYNIYIVDRRQRVVLDGQTLLLEPGDFAMGDSRLRSSITMDEPYTTIGLTVPAHVLRAYVANPARAVGASFRGCQDLSRLVSLTLQEMWRLAETGTLAKVGNRLVVSLLETVSACCELTEPSPDSAPASAAARRTQIRACIQKHLRDPEFSVKSLARELDLSPRYLQMIFDDSGESISQSIRRQRLEGCRRDLADPALRDQSVTAIAFRWGFNSAAHFCRAFRAKFGMSASEFRDHHPPASEQAQRVDRRGGGTWNTQRRGAEQVVPALQALARARELGQ
jgi:AraC family transcriptional activator of tynA and feaB